MRTKICLLGEAWGVEEERAQAPFVGTAGYELNRMLSDAGIHRADCFLTNTFNLHPPGNKLEAFCGTKDQALPGYPALVKGKHISAGFAPELNRLAEELVAHDPNIIIALGNTAMWALLGKTAITKFRGTTELSTHTAVGYKVLPTYHPSYIIRGQWALRPVVILDLQKALRESEYPELRRPQREIWIEPSLEDIREFIERYLRPSPVISVDIETSGSIITCIGFASGPGHAIVIPFTKPSRKDRSYWPTHAAEREAWVLVKGVLELPNRKLFQNGLYDIAFLWRAMGLKVLGAEHDSMLLHHSLQPESLKSLGFLGSIYTDEGPWKNMRKHTTTIKGFS